MSGAPITDPDLAALAALSARLGADRSLIQGAGGNTSLKRGGAELWVKASGTWLAAAERQPIFVGLDLAELRRRMAANEAEPAMPARLDPAGTLRPSIETTLHALLPHAVVVHVHSVNTLAFAVRRDGPDLLAERLAGLRWAWVPYAKPGLPLTRAVQERLEGAPDVLVLGNHGLVIGAGSTEAADALLAEVERRLAVPARATPPPDLPTLERLAARSAGRYRPARLAEAHAAATGPASAATAGRGALYPDHVVFLGPSPLPVLPPDQAEPWLEAATAGADMPALLLVEGSGALLRADLGAGAEEMAACLGLVLPRLDPEAPLVFLSAEQEAELLDWDAEKYRQSLNTAEQ
ncbi:class II aldolase/adducin family protein [Roseomonas sp. E05]|uniref:class II aldolase/adducin family protein n=1 Tax=Roseomonas sp. E05 TaxID=3046310 RepID=UPI0024BB6419|nr:class II aldolase/adducin family protein [Roseomonas sp. E05]MDJ0387763.1 class II aldolase/adducin family protein [Roseomonas sp. E05]